MRSLTHLFTACLPNKKKETKQPQQPQDFGVNTHINPLHTSRSRQSFNENIIGNTSSTNQAEETEGQLREKRLFELLNAEEAKYAELDKLRPNLLKSQGGQRIISPEEKEKNNQSLQSWKEFITPIDKEAWKERRLSLDAKRRSSLNLAEQFAYEEYSEEHNGMRKNTSVISFADELELPLVEEVKLKSHTSGIEEEEEPTERVEQQNPITSILQTGRRRSSRGSTLSFNGSINGEDGWSIGGESLRYNYHSPAESIHSSSSSKSRIWNGDSSTSHPHGNLSPLALAFESEGDNPFTINALKSKQSKQKGSQSSLLSLS